MKYKCTTRYKHNPNAIVPEGAIVEFEGHPHNAYMGYIVYKGRYMLINLATKRKYFTEYKPQITIK